MKLPAGTSKSACGCSGCGRVFSSLTLFDRHQDWDYDAPAALSCKTPESLGLVLGPNSTWWTPEGLKNSKERTARMRAGL